jgi:hypothetical protein
MNRAATVLAALIALGAVGDAAPHGGKVVRVERHSERGLGTPRYCTFQTGVLTHAQCFGSKVEVGETVLLVATVGVVARLEITSVVPDVGCLGVDASWQIDGELEKPAALSLRTIAIWGVVDGGLDPRHAKVVELAQSPSKRQSDNDFEGFDTTGNGEPDLQFDSFTCDAQGQPNQSMNGQCYEVWAAQGRDHELHRVRLDIVPSC